jgi:hypothetical protein
MQHVSALLSPFSISFPHCASEESPSLWLVLGHIEGGRGGLVMQISDCENLVIELKI